MPKNKTFPVPSCNEFRKYFTTSKKLLSQKHYPFETIVYTNLMIVYFVFINE